MSDKPAPKRGRPRKQDGVDLQVRERLIRAGLEALTEHGYANAGLDAILKRAAVPKGSFYHYFSSKEAFARALLAAYGEYFSHRLQRCFSNTAVPPLQRLSDWHDLAVTGMERHQFRRGCLVGNLAVETGHISADFAAELEQVWLKWQQQLSDLLEQAQHSGAIPPQSDCQALAEFFWIGWEGAVLRARMLRNSAPLSQFLNHFLSYCQQP